MISVDTPEDNKAFALKEHADFPMLSNPDKKVAFAYQVIPTDAPPERQFAKRWTYYIDPTGKIAFIDKAVKPATSGQDIVGKLGELNVPKRKQEGRRKKKEGKVRQVRNKSQPCEARGEAGPVRARLVTFPAM